MPAPTCYSQVAIADWSAHSAAGDAAATWQAVQNGVSSVKQHPDGRFAARIADFDTGADRLCELLVAAAEPLIGHIAGAPCPVFSACASKGDTPRLLAHGRPQPIGATPGALSMRVARRLGLRTLIDPLAIAACSSGLYGLLAAADLIEHGRSPVALVGAGDASLQALIEAGFAQLGVLCREQPSAFDGRGTGFAPGEGAAFLALGAEGPWRLTAGIRLGDASHATSCQDPAVLHAALEALWSVAPNPDLIVTHGTGTRLGDAYEGNGLDRGPWAAIPRVAYKPIIGHCLGASASVELAATLSAPIGSFWKLGLGFGGHVAAIAVRRAAQPERPCLARLAGRPDEG